MSCWKYWFATCVLVLTVGTANATTYSFTGSFTSGPVLGCCATVPPSPISADTLSGTLTYNGSPADAGSIVGQTAVSGNPSLDFTTISTVFYGDGYDIVVSPSTTGGYWLTMAYGVWCFYCEEGPKTDLIYGGLSATISTGAEPTFSDGCGGACGTSGPVIETGFVGSELSATPLPATWLMLLSGFVGLSFFAHRGTKKNSAALAAA